MTDSFSASHLLQRRKNFASYNISRLRELIRYLPKKKFELFQTIPFWLHVNLPQIPGYVDARDTPCGIYRFHGSGFWRQASRKYKVTEKQLYSYRRAKEHIIGLYLMGSAGTLAQTDSSDFDYWVVVDDEGVTPADIALFQTKLARISAWCKAQYDQEVGLFVLSQSDVKENKFAAVDEESSGSAQRTFLKEEFYRTFIMIAGKIPYWAVVPVGVCDAEYDQWTRCAAQTKSLQFVAEDYVDLGNLASIGSRECLGALLWQLFKARKYPAKSMIKAGLIAHYFFFHPQSGLLCDRIKAAYTGNRSGDRRIDPYAVVFSTVMDLFKSLDDQQGLSLIRECLFLRLSDSSNPAGFTGSSPRRQLLEQYVSEWQWDQDTINRLSSVQNRTESDWLAFEEKIYKKIGFLYELILRAQDRSTAVLSMAPSDLLMLKNRISAAIKKKPGKLPRCSAYLHARAREFVFQISGHAEGSGKAVWTVYRHADEARRGRHVVYSAPQLLNVLGWLVANGLYPCADARMRYLTFQLPVSPLRIKRLLADVHGFLFDRPTSPETLLTGAQVAKVAIMLCPADDFSGHRLACADFLSLNSWGEIFFESVPLMHIGSAEAIGAKISEHLWKYCNSTERGEFPHRIFQMEGGRDAYLHGIIESGYAKFLETRRAAERLKASGDAADTPWLDLL